ncbi:hypothetical protein [Paenibacillus odorifer]|uniref:Uncharacterized protein n=1 Tax=Paenibacillus odorifer TaxID=189426 RepID=A0A1R0Y7K8_9BACL|nr:hypothetical protein [Paenibacillus odorifer]OMD43347.1 hypothetical protein BSK52_02655 [Paenibacillus odorifer]
MYVGGGAAPQKIRMGDRTLAYPTIELTRHDNSIIQIDEQELRYPAFFIERAGRFQYMVYLNKTKSCLLEAIRIVQSIIGVW